MAILIFFRKEQRMKAQIFTDGSARPNPGKGGAGVLIQDMEGKEIACIAKYLGEGITCNQAEYWAFPIPLPCK